MAKTDFTIEPVLSPRIVSSGGLTPLETLPSVPHRTFLGLLVRKARLRHHRNYLGHLAHTLFQTDELDVD